MKKISISARSVLIKVKIKNLYQCYNGIFLVAEKEADIQQNFSKQSIGKGLLGKKVGDTAEIQVLR